MHNHVSLCHDAVARMDQSYWLFGTSKRLKAANEALDQLEKSPELQPAVQLTRKLTADEPSDKARVPLLREALVQIGALSTFQLAGSSSFLAGVALSAIGPEAGAARAFSALSEVALSSGDPLAAKLAEHQAGRPGLEVLSQHRPQDPAGLAAWASGNATGRLGSNARQALFQQTLEDLAARGDPAPALLQALKAESCLQPGLFELGKPGATPLSVAAAVLQTVPADKRCQAESEVVASLPSPWQGLAAPWLQAASSDAERGAVLRGLAEAAQRQDKDPILALRTAAEEVPLSDALARTALDSIQRLLKSPEYAGFSSLAQQKNLSASQTISPSLDLLEGKLSQGEAIRLASANRPELLAEWLEQKASSESPAQAGFVQSLAAIAGRHDPAQSMQWILEAEAQRPADPGEALKACGGRVEKLPPELLKEVLQAWAPLAATPEMTDKLRLAACDHEALRQNALAGLGTAHTALQIGLSSMRYRSDQAAMGQALESFLPPDWKGFAQRLTAHAPEDAVRAQVYVHCVDQASQGKKLEPASYTPLLNSMLSRIVSDPVGDSIYLALYEAQDAAGKQRLDNWMQISRKLKLNGDASARGAVRLMSDPKLTAGLVASDTVASSRDPRATLELMRWEAECARKASNPKQEAYLSAFVAGCEAAFTDQGRDAASLNALSYWKRVPEPRTLQEAVNQVNATVQSFGDTVQTQAALAEALPLLKPLCSQPGEEPLLDLLIQETRRQDYADPTNQSASLVRAAASMEQSRQSQGEPLAYLGLNMLGSSQEDAGLLQRDVMQAIKEDARRQGDKQRQEVAGFYLDLESWLPPNEAVATMRAGLNLLCGRKYTLLEAVKNTSWPSNVSRMAAHAKWGEIASTSGPPLQRHQGSLLRKMADLPLETVDQRSNAIYYAFYQIGTQPQADPMKQLWLMGQSAFGQAGNGTQCLRLARLTCQELQGLARDTAKNFEAEYFGVMEKVLSLELPHTNDRYYLAQAFLTLEPQKDPQDISRIGPFLTQVANYLNESSLPLVANALLDNMAAACQGWGDTKVLLPQLEKASQTLRQDCSRNKVIEVANQLSKALAGYKENYWLIVSSQGGPRSEIQEKDDSVIVGGVRVAKSRSEGA